MLTLSLSFEDKAVCWIDLILHPLFLEKEEASEKLTSSEAREEDGFVLCILGFVG